MTDVSPDEALAQAGFVPPLNENYTKLDMHKDFRAVFGTDQGKRVLGHLFAMAGLWSQSPLLEGLTASEASMVHEGRRSIALQIIVTMAAVQGDSKEKVIYGGKPRKRG